MTPIGMDAHYAAVSEGLGKVRASASAGIIAGRRERNQLRLAMWAFAAVPWVPERTIDHLEWDVMWRLTFGGMSAGMRHRFDHPADAAPRRRGARAPRGPLWLDVHVLAGHPRDA